MNFAPPFLLPWKIAGRPLSVTLTAGWIVALITFAVYVYTLAPSVTLEDSGEYITAAVTLGVTHPPGYPLWTTISHLFVVLFPFGNVAWRVNLVSAIFGAIANGLLAGLIAHSARWLLGERDAGLPSWLLPFLGAVTAGLCLGFSDVMWSQSVITEVYTLNAVFLITTSSLFYRWIREPEKTGWLLAATGVFALGLTNHHTLLFILPVFLLPIWLVRRDFFPTFLVSLTLLSLSAVAVLAWFSDDPNLEAVTQRLSFVLLLGLFGLLFFQIKKPLLWIRCGIGILIGAVLCFIATYFIGDWFEIETANGVLLVIGVCALFGLLGLSTIQHRFLAAMLVLCWLALSFYGAERFYSSTNPPANWSYARSKGGFFHAISRGQYVNNLTGLLENNFGPPLGIIPPPDPNKAPTDSRVWILIRGIGDYYSQDLEHNFSLVICLVALLGTIAFILIGNGGKLPRAQLHWLIFIGTAFLMLSCFMIWIDPPAAFDVASHAIRRRFFLPAHCIFAIGLGYGVAGALLGLWRYAPQTPRILLGLTPLLALFPLTTNYAASEQRNHWFGWEYGTDMLRNLAPGSVVFGGTDPGRFVPTYMIFCESTQAKRWKRDPSFDRSDLYIITQNALGDYFYMLYLYDQYDIVHRQTHFTPFERWLGRDHAYPKDPLTLPSQADFTHVFMNLAQEKNIPPGPDGQISLANMGDVYSINGDLARFIFEKNKAHHHFYVEESFPIPWMYPYMTPAGLILEINPEPVPLSPEMIAKDRAFWDAYVARLFADPAFANDQDAQNSFSKLRNSFGNLYAARHLNDEALYAYRQALQLSPINPETRINLAHLLLSLGNLQEARQVTQEGIRLDPENHPLLEMEGQIDAWQELRQKEGPLRAALQANPNDTEALKQLLSIQLTVEEVDDAIAMIKQFDTKVGVPPEQMAVYIRLLLETGLGHLDQTISLLEGQAQRHPKNGKTLYQLASLYALAHRTEDAFRVLSKAVALDGPELRAAVPLDPVWQSLTNDPEFKRIMAQPVPVKSKK